MEDSLNILVQPATAFLPKFLLAVLIFLIFWIAARIVKSVVVGVCTKTELEEDIIQLAARSAKGLCLVLGVITALGTAGVNVSALVAGLGLTGFALSFALKDALSNMLAGVLILIYRPFSIGDRISIGASEGEVLTIDFRYTTIQAEGKMVLIPNSTLFKKEISLLNGK